MAGRRKRSRRLGDAAAPTTALAPAKPELTRKQKLLIVGVGLPVALGLGWGALQLWRVFTGWRIGKNGSDGGVEVIDAPGPEVATSNDPRCQNLENALALPKGCGNVRIVGYNRGDRESLVIGEISGYKGHYVQRSPVDTASAAERLLAAARAAGHQVTINSSFRTMASQTSLYKKYRSGRGAPAASPGRSNHQNGMALDISVGAYPKLLQWLLANGPRYGWHKTVKKEDWHYEYKPATDQMKGSAPGVAGLWY